MNVLMEFDKAGAEWVVVAFLADDPNMLAVVRSGESPHVATGHLITSAPKELIILEDKILDKTTDPDELLRVRSSTPELNPLLDLPFLPRSMTIRQAGKKSNHGLNYDMKYRRFALENEIPEADSQMMVDLYNTVAYPGVPAWHKRTRNELHANGRVLTNCFGRKSGRLMGEAGHELYAKAYSFVPQSTVGDIVNRAIRAAYESNRPSIRLADLLTQTHDSATYQYPITGNFSEFLKDMASFAVQFAYGHDFMNPELAYGQHKFHIGTDLKIGLDWGHMQKVKLSEDVTQVAESLSQVLEVLTKGGETETELAYTAVQNTEGELDQEWEATPAVVETLAA